MRSKHELLLPLSVAVYVTDHCQHKCEHCFLTRSERLNINHIRHQDLFRFLDLAAESGVFLVVIAGGDPFLHPQIELILRKIDSLKMRPLIGGNPSDVFEGYIPLLEELRIPTVQFSLDSHLRCVHDGIRQSGSFDKTLFLIQKLRSRGIRVNLSVCVTRRNFKNAADIVRLANEIGVYRLKLVFWQNDGRTNSEDFNLNEQEKLDVVNVVGEMVASAGLRDWIAVPGYSLASLKKTLNKYPGLVIRADGVAVIDETGFTIGSLEKDNIARAYCEYVAASKLDKIRDIFNECVMALGIVVERIYNDGINAAGKVLKIKDHYLIILNSGLPALLSEIVAMHELGHIATETIGFHVNELSAAECISSERVANEWVLKRLSPFLPQSMIEFAGLDLGSDEFYLTLASVIDGGFYIF